MFRLLFRVEFYPQEALREQERLFLEYSGTYMDEDETDYAFEEETGEVRELEKGRFLGEEADHLIHKFEAILTHIPELDEKIDSVSKNWRTGRMGKVELAILRLALYEILYDEDVPPGVAINEAVELTKEFGDDQSPGFVNAVLGRFA
ncbi:MAG: transcription antitermination factor NusB [Lachnospiraceae bacterium]|nr:transcription antitermination factor NusB [Lachnospiraceae bacterium]